MLEPWGTAAGVWAADCKPSCPSRSPESNSNSFNTQIQNRVVNLVYQMHVEMEHAYLSGLK